MYKQKNKDNTPFSDNDDRDTKGNKKNVLVTSKIDPMSNAFPDQNSIGASLSLHQSSMMPMSAVNRSKGAAADFSSPQNQTSYFGTGIYGGQSQQQSITDIANGGGGHASHHQRGRKIGLAATARSNLRVSQAGGFVFEPQTVKNSVAAGGQWPKI